MFLHASIYGDFRKSQFGDSEILESVECLGPWAILQPVEPKSNHWLEVTEKCSSKIRRYTDFDFKSVIESQTVSEIFFQSMRLLAFLGHISSLSLPSSTYYLFNTLHNV